MFATELTQISDLVTSASLGPGGSAMIVDQKNMLVADSEPNTQLMSDMSDYPPVKALREGKSGSFSFTDSKGQRFQAYLRTLPNGWGVIAQQTEAGLFGPINQFQQLAFAILLVGRYRRFVIDLDDHSPGNPPDPGPDPGCRGDQLRRPDPPGSRADRSAGQPG